MGWALTHDYSWSFTAMFKQSEDIRPASLLGPGPKLNLNFPIKSNSGA